MAMRLPLTGMYDHEMLATLTEHNAPLVFMAEDAPIVLETPMCADCDCQFWHITASTPEHAVVEVRYNAFTRTGELIV